MDDINGAEERSRREVRKSGLVDFFYIFHQNFKKYSFLSEETTNFNRFEGHLERACEAAQSIRNDYDLGVGIAKKGLWLSYVFNLHGLPTYDVLIERSGESRRIMPISPLHRRSFKRKRVLLFDNDILTGKTIDCAVRSLMDGKAKGVDLLLTYKYARITPEFYERVKPQFKRSPSEVGETSDGKIILDTACEIPKGIGKTMTLEADFEPSQEALKNLMRKLGYKA